MDTTAPTGPAAGSIRDRLLADRRNLLDLGTRNRLINLPLKARGVRTIEIVEERAAEVYRLLGEGRGFTFLPGREPSPEESAALAPEDAGTAAIPQPDPEEALDERGLPRRQTDTRLQTRLTSEGLQKRLFDIWYDARTLEEEQGVNILYLALGLLRWFEDDASDVARHAPLALLPVRLDRTSAADRFTLRWRGEPASSNLSLESKLNAELGLKLPPFGDDEDLDLPQALAAIAEAVAAKPRWQVQPDAMVLGLFSFAKFLMYRDLDPETWPASAAIDRHPLVAGLLGEGFAPAEPIVAEGDPIDPVIPPSAMRHVVDADSSQAIVIEEVVRGRHLVVKGPPGTGKSQTITNVIAGAAAAGRRVLFVAEKMAALEVVQRRLREAGLGPLTLELHSSKASKRAVLEDLKRTKDLAGRAAVGDATLIDRLTQARDALNAHAARMHAPHAPTGVSPFRLRFSKRLAETAPYATVVAWRAIKPESVALGPTASCGTSA